jgi:hypothetical protein
LRAEDDGWMTALFLTQEFQLREGKEREGREKGEGKSTRGGTNLAVEIRELVLDEEVEKIETSDDVSER